MYVVGREVKIASPVRLQTSNWGNPCAWPFIRAISRCQINNKYKFARRHYCCSNDFFFPHNRAYHRQSMAMLIHPVSQSISGGFPFEACEIPTRLRNDMRLEESEMSRKGDVRLFCKDMKCDVWEQRPISGIRNRECNHQKSRAYMQHGNISSKKR